MIRVDLERRVIQASVGGLVTPPEDVPRPAGPLAQARTQIGTSVHQGYRLEREADTAGFRAEVHVGLRLEVDGFEARVRGRVDGLLETEDGTLTVEEVKSVGVTAMRLEELGGPDLADAFLQVRLYALCLQEERPDAVVRPRLVLVSIVDGSRREIDVDFDAERVRTVLRQRLRREIEAAEAAALRASERARFAEQLRFPYATQRLHQPELGDAVTSALEAGRPILAEAPTGIGKTAAVIVPALRFSLAGNGTLFFLTAKNTQQALVARTFEDVVEASGFPPGAVRALTFREKRRMCPPETLLCHPDHCDFLKGFLDRPKREDVLEAILEDASHLDPDGIFETGREAEVCPYALALALSLRVDLVICDFNYVYDPAVSFSLFAEDAPEPRITVVVDEAHNLFDRAREYYSPFLARVAVERMEKKVGRGDFHAPGEREAGPMLPRLGAPVDAVELFGAITKHFAGVRAHLDDMIRRAEEEHPAAIDGCRPIRPDPEPWNRLADGSATLLVRYAHYVQAHGLVRPDDPLVDAFRSVMAVRDLLVLDEPEFVPYAASNAQAPDRSGVGVLCVNPAPKLTERHRRVLGTVAMSATLTPLEYYEDVLGFVELEPVGISFPSPFPEEHRCIVVVPTVGTTWRERKRHYEGIARVIEQVIAVRPGHYVVYFPSFRFLADVQKHLRLPGEVELLVQESRMPPAARARVLERLRSPRGPALLLAVMGGVFAEGIDLPGEALIGAMVVGPGLPQVGFERAAMRHYFDEKAARGFAYAMLFPGLQRVIQSAGRVHRTPEDAGVIVLLGRRFAQSPYADHLPAWWSRYGPEALVGEDAATVLEAFWAGIPSGR